MLTRYRPSVAGSILEYAVVGSLLFAASVILTNGLLFSMNDKIFAGGIGDATSGFLWYIFADADRNPLWGHTNLINYPYGHDLSNPIFITWTLVFGPLWLVSRIVSPVAALYLVTLGGFISCGLVMYLVVKRITGDWSAALFASYAAAFMPYHILKSSAHLTNVYSWVFVAIIACSIAFWRQPNKRRGALLAVAIAAAMYTDGYYIFVGGVLCIALLAALCIVDVVSGVACRKIVRKLGGLTVVALGVIVLLLPIVWVQISASSQIQQGLSSLRGDIKKEVASYAAKPIDLLLPAQGNVLVGNFDWYERLFAQKNERSNNTENTSYIGYVVMGLAAYGAITATKALVRLRRTGGTLSLPNYVILVCIIAIPLTLVWMLPPQLFGFTMPVGYLTDLTSYWRVPSRVFLALHPLFVIAAALGLFALMRTITNKRIALAVAMLALLVTGLEYSTSAYRPSFGFSDMPKAYTWLAGQQDIQSIAETPFVDRPTEITGYYLFAQMIHKKPIVNSHISTVASGQYNTLGDVSNPEMVNFVRSRKADAIVVHTKGSCTNPEWGQLVYAERPALSPPFMDDLATTICIYTLDNAPPQDEYYPLAAKGFQSIDYRDEAVRYWLILDSNQPVIEVADSQGRPVTEPGQANFSAELSFIGTAPDKQLNWQVQQQGITVASGNGRSLVEMKATINPQYPINLRVTTDDFFRVPPPGELVMRAVRIDKL